MKQLHRIRVTAAVASTRADGQGITNVVLLDAKGRNRRTPAGELVILTFSASPTFIAGKLPPEVADSPLLLIERITARDLPIGAEILDPEIAQAIDDAARTAAAVRVAPGADDLQAPEPPQAPIQDGRPLPEFTDYDTTERESPGIPGPLVEVPADQQLIAEPTPDVVFNPSPVLEERVTVAAGGREALAAELATTAWRDLQTRANRSGLKTFGMKRTEVEAAILEAELAR